MILELALLLTYTFTHNSRPISRYCISPDMRHGLCACDETVTVNRFDLELVIPTLQGRVVETVAFVLMRARRPRHAREYYWCRGR